VSAHCPRCGEPVADDDQFCESCGTELRDRGPAHAPATEPDGARAAASGPPPGPSDSGDAGGRRCTCGGQIDADGWCTVCGLRAPSERDHFSDQPAPHVAAVCDRGRVHPRNEDAVALGAAEGRTVLVVCDGVTTATDSDVAALAAARAARDALVGGPPAPPPSASPAARNDHWTARLIEATGAAQAAAAASASDVAASESPPSCTFVASVVEDATITTGWVGDSRAYWFGDDGTATQLSVDDSWASEQIAHGMDRAAAEADPRAHTITRWLGADSTDTVPSCASITASGPGWLLVCTDGLWNYSSEPVELGALVARCAADVGGDPLGLAGRLVDWANARGGHDNVTAALARVEPGSRDEASVVAASAARASSAVESPVATSPTRKVRPRPNP
jgi:serine/threonine protein phosphatase PrpC